MCGILLCGVMSDYIRGMQRTHRLMRFGDLPEVLCENPVLQLVSCLTTCKYMNQRLKPILLGYLDNWVSFAVSSRTKALVFDLAPVERQLVGRDDRYRFLFQLLDKESICRLQKIHLSFVDFQPPTHECQWKDIQHMLSNCCNLEWLSIVNLLIVRLLYLKIAYCNITSIAFDAANLVTFKYKGSPVPIDLSKSSELACADIWFARVTLGTLLLYLLKCLQVHGLSLHNFCVMSLVFYLSDSRLMHHGCEFSQMRYLQLRLVYVEEFDILSLISFMRCAPFILKLELQEATEHPFNNLKSLHVTGFKACIGQVELLSHMVENALHWRF
ncbi:hypothetical protein ZWY2020_041216 [Hordeum vulgare]|nr:hypothetical protein ZWY2020_041216 [Hordeum vulgare]